MPRIGGRNGRVYMSTTSAGAATPVAFLSSWSLDQSADVQEVTAMGDGSKTYILGLPDATGQIQGFYDDAGSNQIYAAATAEGGSAKRMYIYPSTSDVTKYFFGTAFVSVSISSEVNGAVEFSGSFNAASTFAGVGV
jgi:hypothetical protein